MSNSFKVGRVAEFAAGTATRVDVGGVPVAVVRIEDDFYAIGDRCTHADIHSTHLRT